MTRLTLGLALTLLLVAVTVTAADELSEKSERLDALRERIDAVKDALAADREREDTATVRLRELEKRLGELAAEVDRLDERLAAKRERVDSLREEVRRESERLANHRRFLRRQIYAAYASGREEYLRLLLNQERPERVDRMLVYYDYLNAARGARIREAVAALDSLQRLRDTLERETGALTRLKAERGERLATLRAERREREALVQRLRERIDSRDSELGTLRADAERLSELVERLRRSLADVADAGVDNAPFGKRKGDLGWPLQGPLLEHYGSRRSQSARWGGLLIGAESGDPVRAVAHGRVVFSDWLRGLGLLLIIDHGDGYLTLYGHNQSLYSEVGDWVTGGDVVATVGATGGRDRAALYFEVRSNGQPVDPTAWLGPRPSG